MKPLIANMLVPQPLQHVDIEEEDQPMKKKAKGTTNIYKNHYIKVQVRDTKLPIQVNQITSSITEILKSNIP